MKVHLLSPDADFDPELPDPPLAEELAADLELDYLWNVMGAGDSYLRKVARAALLLPGPGPGTVRYRQQAYADAHRNPDALSTLYQISVDALSVKKGLFLLPARNHPEMELSRAVRLLTALVDHLERLRKVSEQVASDFESVAFCALFDTIAANLDSRYLDHLRNTLRELSFRDGMLMSARIQPLGQVGGQVLRVTKRENHRLFSRTPLKRPFVSWALPDRDEAGANALAELRERSVNDVANAALQSVDHVMSFFETLRAELGFFLACANAVRALNEIGCATAQGVAEPDTRAMIARSLYDPCLAIRTGQVPTSNDVVIGDGGLLVITGANHGGKSTLLRAIGVAQLMLHAGMPVPAQTFTAGTARHVLTHWAREEDTNLVHGKFDEELERMSAIVQRIAPADLLLLNESFASTNEAEGSRVLEEVTRALASNGVRIVSVTHLFDYSQAIARDSDLHADFIRAPRGDQDDQRTYRLVPGPPLPTSFGLDLYDELFGTSYASAYSGEVSVDNRSHPRN